MEKTAERALVLSDDLLYNGDSVSPPITGLQGASVTTQDMEPATAPSFSIKHLGVADRIKIIIFILLCLGTGYVSIFGDSGTSHPAPKENNTIRP